VPEQQPIKELCPVCGTNDGQKRDLVVEGQGEYRIISCDECARELKASREG
jgi:hypothetical protein